MDRVSATWQIWGATTFNCVQCHDHPYDTFRQEEYYRFMAFFNNTADSDLSNEAPLLKTPLDPRHHEEALSLDQKILRLQTQYWQMGKQLQDQADWIRTTGLQVSSNNGTQYVVEKFDDHDAFHTVGTVQTKTAVTIQIPTDKSKDPIQAIRFTFLPLDPDTSRHSPEWGFVISKLEAWVQKGNAEKQALTFAHSFADVPWMPQDPFKPIAANGVGFGADSRIHHARELTLIPESPITPSSDQSITFTISCNKTGHGHPMVIKRGHLAFSTSSKWDEFRSDQHKIHSIEHELTVTRKQRDAIPAVAVPVMMERPENIMRPTHVFMRGNFLDKGKQVNAALPASMKETNDEATLNRLDMAQWWASKENPLTARVFVNRVWEQLFGMGIVPTLEDFGSAGEAPTHPELLDYLALRFQNEHNWSTKSLMRDIVLSATYQQSSKLTPEVLDKDPENRFLARGPRGRLPAEMVRDQALAFSGLLSNKMGGPPVRPSIPEGVWQPFDASDKWNTPEKGDANRYRRSLYTYIKRSIPYPAFASFDAPSREFCTPRRLVSNTPIQALVTLNDTTFFECAEAFGTRMRDAFPGSIRDKLARAYRQVTARHASPSRLDALENLYNQLNTQETPSTEASPWLVVAQVLLNLDEVLNF